jgi:hypothetical protein
MAKSLFQTDVPALDHQIAQLMDKKESVWTRANYRKRLVEIRDALFEVIQEFDCEYARANQKPHKPEKVARK